MIRHSLTPDSFVSPKASAADFFSSLLGRFPIRYIRAVIPGCAGIQLFFKDLDPCFPAFAAEAAASAEWARGGDDSI